MSKHPRTPQGTRYHQRKLHEMIHNRIVRLMGPMTQAELAKKAGVALTTLNPQMLKKSFTLDLLAKVAPGLGTSLAYLVGEEGIPETIDRSVAREALLEIDAALERAKRRG